MTEVRAEALALTPGAAEDEPGGGAAVAEVVGEEVAAEDGGDGDGGVPARLFVSITPSLSSLPAAPHVDDALIEVDVASLECLEFAAAAAGVRGYCESDVGTNRSLPTGEITELLESGVDSREIVRRMVATGDWSEAGAVGFVSFLTHGLDAPASPVRVEHPGRRGDTA